MESKLIMTFLLSMQSSAIVYKRASVSWLAIRFDAHRQNSCDVPLLT